MLLRVVIIPESNYIIVYPKSFWIELNLFQFVISPKLQIVDAFTFYISLSTARNTR